MTRPRWCAEECASLNVFAAGACPCHEAARTALDQTETAKRGRSGVRVTRGDSDAAKHNEGDK